MGFIDSIKHAWNAFLYKDTREARQRYYEVGTAHTYPVHRTPSTGRSNFTSAVYNRIALDIAVTEFRHIKMDSVNTDKEEVKESGLHKCLTYSANKDQTHLQFKQDIVYSMFDEGYVAVVPIDTEDTVNPDESEVIKINTMRVGQIMRWMPDHVELNVYNDRSGNVEQLIMRKESVAILENPLYAVINGPNMTLNRLRSKMAIVDNIDSITGSGRLDILVQLPYSATNAVRRTAVDDRITQIENDLKRGTNGVAYIQHNEKVVQLNRPANSQVIEQVEMLKEEFYNQLGITSNIMNGTASEGELRTYYARSIDPIIDTITAEFNRKFLTKTAYTQGHRIKAYRDTFQFVSTQQIADLSDKLRRNEIASSNEIRKIIGLPPSNDPNASLLYNPNMPDKDQVKGVPSEKTPDTSDFKSREEVDKENEELEEDEQE